MPLETSKRFLFYRDAARIEVEYEITNQGPGEARVWFGVELNLTLLGGNNPQRHFLFPGLKVEDRRLCSSGAIPEVGQVRWRDKAAGFEVSFDLSPKAQLWRFPLETVSQSESGLQKTYQGMVLLFHWAFSLKPGERKALEHSSFFCRDSAPGVKRREEESCPNCGKTRSPDDGSSFLPKEGKGLPISEFRRSRPKKASARSAREMRTKPPRKFSPSGRKEVREMVRDGVCAWFPTNSPPCGWRGRSTGKGVGLYDKMSGIGAHEVIIETPNHEESLSTLTPKQFEEVLWAYRDRMLDLRRDIRLRYAMIFKNHGEAAGATLEHSHSQLIALPIVPHLVMEEMAGARDYYQLQGTMHLLRYRPSGNPAGGAGRPGEWRVYLRRPLRLFLPLRSLDSPETARLFF